MSPYNHDITLNARSRLATIQPNKLVLGRKLGKIDDTK